MRNTPEFPCICAPFASGSSPISASCLNSRWSWQSPNDPRAVLPAGNAVEVPFTAQPPLGRLSLVIAPVLLEGILRSVEQHHRIARRLPGLCRHLHRVRTVHVMHRPGMPGVRHIAIYGGDGGHRSQHGRSRNHRDCFRVFHCTLLPWMLFRGPRLCGPSPLLPLRRRGPFQRRP